MVEHRRPGSGHAAAERVARTSYGRLLAYFATRWRDVAAAEDALSDAFAAALERWPRDGVPEHPEAWLLTVTKRKLTDAARGAAVRRRDDVIARLTDLTDLAPSANDPAVDDRLRLMLVCAHPAIDAAIRPALILQTVLGLEVKQMASAFVVSPETLNKRLVRAKAKIKATGMRFEEPEPEDLGPRLHTLLEALYAAYFLGRDGVIVDGDGSDLQQGAEKRFAFFNTQLCIDRPSSRTRAWDQSQDCRKSPKAAFFSSQLGREALELAAIVAAHQHDHAEALGLYALMMFCEARRPAQQSAVTDFVPLLEQDTTLWDRDLLRAAFTLLGDAAALKAPGPFQLEAAIQGAHCSRAKTGVVPWPEIAALYGLLVERYPTIGAKVSMAVAVAFADDDPARGIDLLHDLERAEAARLASYQPYWVALAHLEEARGQPATAARALDRALALTSHPRARRHLLARRARLDGLLPQ